jgi:hypothetical protein
MYGGIGIDARRVESIIVENRRGKKDDDVIKCESDGRMK